MVSDWQALYFQLGALLGDAPENLAGPGPVTSEMRQWMGRACALVRQVGNGMDTITLETACDHLDAFNRDGNASKILTTVYRALGVAESKAPAVSHGAFIPVGHEFDTFVAFGKLLGKASALAFIVDPFMDEKVLTEFALLVPEGVELQLLTDERDHKPSLAPAIVRWRTQYSATRPLQVRLSPWRALHDRLIVLDDKHAWTLTQSLNAFAARSPATIVKVDADTAQMKISAYAALWESAKPM